jgi:hypothetical protein
MIFHVQLRKGARGAKYTRRSNREVQPGCAQQAYSAGKGRPYRYCRLGRACGLSRRRTSRTSSCHGRGGRRDRHGRASRYGRPARTRRTIGGTPGAAPAPCANQYGTEKCRHHQLSHEHDLIPPPEFSAAAGVFQRRQQNHSAAAPQTRGQRDRKPVFFRHLVRAGGLLLHGRLAGGGNQQLVEALCPFFVLFWAGCATGSN